MFYKHKKLVACFAGLIVIILYSFWVFYYQNRILAEKDAFISVYGNYDSVHKSALWRDMHTPCTGEFDQDVWKNKIGSVSRVFFKSFKEAGKQKAFFITKTIPTTEPYECHACHPILNATVFVRHKRKWRIESQNLFLMREGEYAASPISHLVQVGRDRYGVTLEFEHRNGEFLVKELYLVIPYKTSITTALEETIYYDNFNSCGWGMQCATFSSALRFYKTSADQFYPLKVKRFGTQNDEQQHDRAVPVDEESTYQFREGKYTQTNWKGFPKFNYEKSLE